MAYNYEYPYTDPNRYNDDWAINKVKELMTALDGIYERAIAETKLYVDERTAELRAEVAEFEKYTQNTIDILNKNYENFSKQVQDQIVLFDARISAFRREIDDAIVGVNARTDLAIAQNNEYIFNRIAQEKIDIKVINYFTGEQVTVQNMFNYLARFHLADAMTYTELAEAVKTVTALINANQTYTAWAVNGKTILGGL